MEDDNNVIWCVEVCDFDECWYHRIYDTEKEAELHVKSYKLKDDEQDVNLVKRVVDNKFYFL